MTTNVGTAHWMAPELFTDTGDYGKEVDVYSYGMLLWELLNGRTPFHGKQAMQVAYMVCKEQKRPSFKAGTPEPLKKLISQCWANAPNKRPSFDKVIKKFKSHEVEFQGTDHDVVNKLFEEIKENKPREYRKYEYLPLKFQDPKNKRKQPPKSQAQNSKKIIMPNPNSATFNQDLQAIADGVKSKDAHFFFSTIKKIYFEKNIPLEPKTGLLNSILLILEKDQNIIHTFIDKEIHKCLGFETELADQTCNILYRVFTFHTESVTPEILNGLSEFITVKPREVLVLLNIYLNALPKAPNFSTASDIFFDNIDKFENSLGIDKVIKIIFTVSKMHECFIENRDQIITELLKKPFKLPNNKNLSLRLYILKEICSVPLFSNALPMQMISPYLTQQSTSNYVLYFFANHPEIELDKIILTNLLQCSESNKLASYILFNRCDDDNIACIVASLVSENYFDNDGPSLKIKTKLLFILLCSKRASIIIEQSPSFIRFLCKLSKSNDVKILKSLQLVLSKINITTEFVRNLYSTDFLPNYYNCLIKLSQDSQLYIDIIRVTYILAYHEFSPQFYEIFHILDNLLKIGGWEDYVIPVLSIISKYKESHQELIKYDFKHKYLMKNVTPSTKQYVDYYLRNIEK